MTISGYNATTNHPSYRSTYMGLGAYYNPVYTEDAEPVSGSNGLGLGGAYPATNIGKIDWTYANGYGDAGSVFRAGNSLAINSVTKKFWASGANDKGQLGIGNTNNTNIWSAPLNAISANLYNGSYTERDPFSQGMPYSHMSMTHKTAVLWTKSGVFGWGDNSLGQLSAANTVGAQDEGGYGTTLTRPYELVDNNGDTFANYASHPSSLPADAIMQVGASRNAVFLLQRNGDVIARGHPIFGSSHSTWTTVATNVGMMSISTFAYFFVKKDGSVTSYGGITPGQHSSLGAGLCSGTVDSSGNVVRTTSETEIIPSSERIVQVSASPTHALFVKEDGTLLGLGQNDNYQFGNNNTTYLKTPTSIPFTASSLGVKHAYAFSGVSVVTTTHRHGQTNVTNNSHSAAPGFNNYEGFGDDVYSAGNNRYHQAGHVDRDPATGARITFAETANDVKVWTAMSIYG